MDQPDFMYLATFLGRQFEYTNPLPSMIDIRDIAQHLSNIGRFCGGIQYKDKKNVEQLWSVAKHSLYVAELAPKELKLAALLHDATEAYVGDVPSPLKRMVPKYKEIEEQILAAIVERFGLSYGDLEKIRTYDYAALGYEVWFLQPNNRKHFKWCPLLQENKVNELRSLAGLGIESTRNKFLNTYYKLCPN